MAWCGGRGATAGCIWERRRSGGREGGKECQERDNSSFQVIGGEEKGTGRQRCSTGALGHFTGDEEKKEVQLEEERRGAELKPRSEARQKG